MAYFIKNIKLYVLLTPLLTSSAVSSQIIYNNGAPITITSGGIVQINGGAENSLAGNLDNNGNTVITGDFTNHATAGGNGTYTVGGNWINNGAFNSGTGTVNLNGAAQNIGGSNLTHFYNLTLTGSGIKTQTIDQNVMHLLALNDRELATGSHTMFFTNTDPAAITRTTGFVSSTTQGSLSRTTYNAESYLFPVGSSAGTMRYRPVEISPAVQAANTFTVRLANTDATLEGFDRAQVDSSICASNPLYFHRINRSSGTSAAGIKIFFDAAADGNWAGIANWYISPGEWINTGIATYNGGTPLSNLTLQGWNHYENIPYVLINKRSNATIFPIDSICLSDAPVNLMASETGGTWSGTGITDAVNGVFSPSVSGTGEFTITYTLPGTCGDADSKQISVEDCSVNNIYIPNIFSPNGDNQNDVLYVRGTYNSIHFTIFDRWGEKVFETKDGTTGWDGKYKEKPMNPGVFVYYADIVLANGTTITKKGNVTLVR